MAFKSSSWFDFCHDNIGTQSFGSHGATFAAVTVPTHDKVLAGNQDGSGPKDPIQRGLCRTVHIIKVPFGFSIVYSNNWIFQLTSRAIALKRCTPVVVSSVPP